MCVRQNKTLLHPLLQEKLTETYLVQTKIWFIIECAALMTQRTVWSFGFNQISSNDCKKGMTQRLFMSYCYLRNHIRSARVKLKTCKAKNSALKHFNARATTLRYITKKHTTMQHVNYSFIIYGILMQNSCCFVSCLWFPTEHLL